MAVLLGLLSLAALSLFFGRVLARSLSVMPLVAMAACSLWFTCLGCLGLLRMAGWLWYAACFAAGGWVIYKEKQAVLRRLTPGFVFFVLGGVFFVVLYSITQPMLVAFDEFTFWGTAAKVTAETNQLYTVANSSLIARVYPPALTLINYAMQFLGAGFSEPGLIASYTLVYLAGFAACAAFLDKRPATASLLLAALFLLPLFFEVAPLEGNASWAYLTCYADPALAAVFGGALGLYFTGGKRDGALLLMLALVLAYLTNIKDIGFALALLVWLVAVADLALCERGRLGLWRLKGWRAFGVFCALLAAAVVAMYVLWMVHLRLAPDGANRLDLGNETKGQLGMLDVLLPGLLALVGINRSEEFSHILRQTLSAFLHRPVSLLGSGARVLAVIVVLLVFTWLLCRTKQERRRVAVFAATSAVGFVAYSAFLLILYSYIFSWVEASVLKDYDRYILPYWQGWLMATLALLSATAVSAAGRTAWRAALARLTVAGVAVCMGLAVALRTNVEANFLRVSPSAYTTRWDVQAVVRTAEAEGLEKSHRVYIVNQYDTDTRFYMMGYELPAVRVKLYAGVDEDGALLSGSAASWLRDPSAELHLYDVAATPAQLSAYLEAEQVTHLLLDEIDDRFVALFAGMFEGGLAGYDAEGGWQGGLRYWQVEYPANGPCRFVPVGEANQ